MRKWLQIWALMWATMFVVFAASEVVMPVPTYLFAWSDLIRWAVVAAVGATGAAISYFMRWSYHMGARIFTSLAAMFAFSAAITWFIAPWPWPPGWLNVLRWGVAATIAATLDWWANKRQGMREA